MLIIEKDIENYLKNKVDSVGGRCLKFTSPATDGVPDRIVILPYGKVAFVELKRPNGGRLSKIQEYQIEKLRIIGCKVYVIRNFEEVDDFINEMLYS